MSELIKKLERISGEKGQPLGFGATAKPKSAPMMLIARLPKVETGIVNSAISKGAEALLFDVKDPNDQAEAFSQIVSSVGQIPWGVRLKTADIEGIGKLADAGCDYLVFGSEVSAQILGTEKMGKVLEVDTSLSDSLARAIGQVSIDAILLNRGDESPLTLYRLMQCQRLISLAGKPALAFLPPNTSYVETLRDIGVGGVVIDLSGEHPEERLSVVREAIQKLPTSKSKSRERISATLPMVVQSTDEEFDEEI